MSINNNLPWYAGNAGRTTTETRRAASSFARQIVESDAYRKQLLLRAATGALPPNIEAMLWHYGYGKPTEHIEIEDTTQKINLNELSEQQIERRILEAQKRLRVLRSLSEEDQESSPSSPALTTAAYTVQ